MVPIAAADCVGPAVKVIEPQASFLTGKTITGWRSIALDKIVTIRFRRTPRPGYAPYAPDFLMIADADGARLGVGTGDLEALRCLADAVGHSAGRVIRISPGALRVLDLEPAGTQHARCRDTSFMVTSVLLWLPLVAVYLLSVGNWIP